eukprot:6188011-Pleurochrysis_carterae.AAC.1
MLESINGGRVAKGSLSTATESTGEQAGQSGVQIAAGAAQGTSAESAGSRAKDARQGGGMRTQLDRRAAVATELARGVSVDMLVRAHTQGPNKQEEHGARAKRMAHLLGRVDSRSIVRAALFDLLFGSGDRHLEHVLLAEDGSLNLIDNAHAVLLPPHERRHLPNS